MAKKCIPGVICIENMTLFILILIVGIIVYVIYSHYRQTSRISTTLPNIMIVQQPGQNMSDTALLGLAGSPIQIGGTTSLASISGNRLNDPYAPPLKDNGYFHPRDSSDIRGIPVNIETRGSGMAYQQIGILTPLNGSGGDALILPLMGRKWMNGRDKWQYYTMANGTSNINTKLPVSVNGKSCTGEYGCNEIQNGDTVYVEGYKTVFTATIYESGNFSYIPYL